jgi:hypothetical protein
MSFELRTFHGFFVTNFSIKGSSSVQSPPLPPHTKIIIIIIIKNNRRKEERKTGKPPYNLISIYVPKTWLLLDLAGVLVLVKSFLGVKVCVWWNFMSGWKYIFVY